MNIVSRTIKINPITASLVLLMILFSCSKKIDSTGLEIETMKSFDEMMISFMKKYKIPGGAIAVTKDSRLIYARGFGYADVKVKAKVKPRSLFRIASLAKPITGAAVTQLMEKGFLKASDKMIDVLDLNNQLSENLKINPAWQKITVENLLTHTGGWDRDKDIDPMFYSPQIVQSLKIDPPAKAWDIIKFMSERPLQFEPGSQYVYSNFGYTLLGRIIEKTTGMTYEEYVQNMILKPLGIQHTQIGKTLRKSRVDGEVTYYFSDEKFDGVVPPHVGKPVQVPYGCWYLEAMDAHGGWISSVVEMALFLCAFDNFDNCKILDRYSIQRMYHPPNSRKTEDDSVHYGYGWWVRQLKNGKYNAWHTGLLPGTSSLMVRRHDGINWVIIFNAGKPRVKDGSFGGVIDPLVHKAAAKVKHWPTHDLFSEYVH